MIRAPARRVKGIAEDDRRRVRYATVEAEVRIPKAGKTTIHWVLEALMIIVSVGLAFGVAEYRESHANHELATRVLRSLHTDAEKLLVDFYRRHLPATRAAAR